jgi:hypothetical protein
VRQWASFRVTIVVVCQFCRARYRFRDEAAGRSVTCEHCGDIISVPVKDANGIAAPAPTYFGAEIPSAKLREMGPPRPIDPKRPDRPIDPTRPAVSDSMFKVGIGLRLVFLDALLSGLIYVALVVEPFFLPPQLVGPWWFRSLAALQWLWVLVMMLGMLGRGICLLVPGESQAKPFILTSVLLEFFFMMITVLDVSRMMILPREAYVAGQICQLFAHVLFLGFLRRLAYYLHREDLYQHAQHSFALGAVFVVAALAATLSRFFFIPGIAQLFFLGNFIAAPMLFFPYLRLLHQFRKAVDALQ